MHSFARILAFSVLMSACTDIQDPVQSITFDHTAAPTAVFVPGTMNSEMGCAGDWDPACPHSQLSLDPEDDVWKGTYSIPVGTYEYKVAINGSWDENYGLNAIQNGANISLMVSGDQSVTFFYSHQTHWVTSTANSVLATAAGSFQSELGCFGDWEPACLRSWLQDPDGDGTATFTTHLPPGDYETKVALDRSWTINYGLNGEPNGDDIPFTVYASSDDVGFSYDGSTHVLTIDVVSAASIDILPGMSPNLIKLNRHPITVAILGSSAFDVSGIDVSSIRFGPSRSTEIHDLAKSSVLEKHLTDVNADGRIDLLTHFRPAETGLKVGDVEACLSAQLTAGGSFTVCDAVVVSGK